MNPETSRDWRVRVAVLTFLASGAAGWWDAAHPSAFGAAVARLRPVGRFLEEARPLVPRGARVVVVTAQLPSPNFEFWFGADQPVPTLTEVTRAGVEAEVGTTTPEFIDAIKRQLAERGVLLTREAFDRFVGTADYVVITDDLETDLSGPALRSAQTVLADGPRRLLRIAR